MILTAQFGVIFRRLIELELVGPRSQIAISSQIYQIGAFLGVPSAASLATFAIRGRSRSSDGWNLMVILKVSFFYC